MGLFGYENCQMLMSVVRVEVSDIRLNLFSLRAFLGFFCCIYYRCFTRVLAPYTLLKITPLVFILFESFSQLLSLYILPLFYKGISTLHPVKNHTFGLDFVVFPFIKLCLV